MSLFQCEVCGCVENTALSCQGCKGIPEAWFCWDGLEERKGKMLCSACMPAVYSDGNHCEGEYGQWHNDFKRVFLPMGMFKTNGNGDLEHKESGDTDYMKYQLYAPTYARRPERASCKEEKK